MNFILYGILKSNCFENHSGIGIRSISTIAKEVFAHMELHQGHWLPLRFIPKFRTAYHGRQINEPKLYRNIHGYNSNYGKKSFAITTSVPPLPSGFRMHSALWDGMGIVVVSDRPIFLYASFRTPITSTSDMHSSLFLL